MQIIGGGNIQKTDNYDISHSLFVGSFEKGLRVLQAFLDTYGTLSLVEIEKITGLNRSAVQRFTHTLHQLGYLTKDENTKQYLPAARVLDFAYMYLRSDPLIDLAAPHLLDASDQSQEVVNLGKLVGIDIIYLIRIPKKEGKQPIPQIGERVPVYCTSSGRAILSGRSQEEVDSILDICDYKALTPYTITDRSIIMDLIEQTKMDGFTISEQEYLRSEITVAAPVLNNKNRAVATVHMSVDKKNWDPRRVREELAPVITRTASIISRTQGGKSTY